MRVCGGGEEVGRIREEFEPQRQMRVPEKKRTDENGEEKKNTNWGTTSYPQTRASE